MTKERAIWILALLGVIAAQIGTLEHGWKEAMTPQFIASAIGQIVIALRLMVTQEKWDGTERRK